VYVYSCTQALCVCALIFMYVKRKAERERKRGRERERMRGREREKEIPDVGEKWGNRQAVDAHTLCVCAYICVYM